MIAASPNMWESPVLLALIPVVFVVFGAIGYLFKGWVATLEKGKIDAEARADKERKESAERELRLEAKIDKVEKERETFQKLLQDSVKTLPVAVNNMLERQGQPANPLIAPVVPFSNSPVTPEQERQAEMFTASATIEAAKLILGLPPRTPGEPTANVTNEITVQEVAVGEPKIDGKKEGAP